MLTTYQRIMSLKRLEAKLQRDHERDEREVVPSVLVALIIKRAEETKR